MSHPLVYINIYKMDIRRESRSRNTCSKIYDVGQPHSIGMAQRLDERVSTNVASDLRGVVDADSVCLASVRIFGVLSFYIGMLTSFNENKDKRLNSSEQVMFSYMEYSHNLGIFR